MKTREVIISRSLVIAGAIMLILWLRAIFSWEYIFFSPFFPMMLFSIIGIFWAVGLETEEGVKNK